MDCRRRLEWTQCRRGVAWGDLAASIAEASPAAWEPVCRETLIQDIDEAPGWFALMLWVRVDGHLRRGDHPVQLSGDVWVYMDLYDSEEDWYYECRIAVREVHSGVIFNCSLSKLEDKRFQAVFTNLAGNEVLRFQHAQPPKLTKGCLVFLTQIHSRRQGMLQSQNQEVRVLLNNTSVELPADTVLCENGDRC